MGIVQPRPAVHLTDPRQVLIVGTISSGTSQVANDLKNKLGLEIGHENAVASWSFVRDGTVSWFHGIRYIPRPGIDNNAENNFVDDRNILEGKLLSIYLKIPPHMNRQPRYPSKKHLPNGVTHPSPTIHRLNRGPPPTSPLTPPTSTSLDASNQYICLP